MPRPATRLLLIPVVLLAVAVATAGRDPAHVALGGAAALVEPPRRLPDPLPLRRVFLPPDKLDPITTAAGDVTYRKLPKDEFETKVQAAAVAVEAERTPPALARAAYRASYATGQLTGSVEWAVSNPSGRPAPLTAEPLKAAVGTPAWADGSPATLFRGKLTGRELNGTYLWVDRPSGGVVTLPWSLRGAEEPDAERFDLGFPPAAIATLDLALPAGLLPTTPTAGVLLTGPLPGPGGDQRVWRLAFGGLSNVTLAVRKTGAAVAEPAHVTRTARYDLSPGVARAAFEFAVESPRGSAREFTFDVAPGLRVTDVGGDPHDRWRFDPPPDPQANGKLVVTMREPAATAKVVVSATTVLPNAPQAWSFPGVSAPAALPGPDTIEVALHPDLKFDGWTAGDYRVRVPGVAADRALRVQFQGTLAAAGATRRRGPSIRLRPADVEWATEEALDWRVEPGRSRLTARLKVRVLRGPLPALTVKAEPGFALDSVTLTPDDSAVTFGRLPGSPDEWLVEPSRAIPTGQTVNVRLDFQGPSAVRAADPGDHAPSAVAVPFPRFAPVGVADRQGTLTAVGADGLKAVGRAVTPVAPLGPASFGVAYRGREPDGHALFTPDRPTAGLTGIDVAVAGKTATTTLSGWCEETPLGSLTLFVPGEGGSVKADGGTCHQLPPLHLLPLFGGSGWVAARGTFWRVTFARPLRGEFAVTATYPLAKGPVGEPLPLPLPKLLGAEVWEPKLNLSAEFSAYRPVSETDVRAALDRFAPQLTLVPTTDPLPEAAGWRFADARLTSGVDVDGGLSAVFTVRVTDAVGPALTVGLPPGAVFDSATVAGKWVTPTGPITDRVNLPLPDAADGTPVELRYRLPTPSGWPLRECRSPTPTLPGGPPVETRWAFAPGHRAWPTLAGEVSGTDAVRVVGTPLPWAVGFAVAGLLAAFGLRVIAHPRRWPLLGIAAVAAGCGGAALLAPDGWRPVVRPPLVAAFGVLAVAVVCRSRQAGDVSAVSGSHTRVVLGLLAACGATWVAGAKPGDPTTVYVVNGRDKLAVFAPQPLLDQLDTLAGSKVPAVVLTTAEYTGAAGEAAVTFDAAFTLVVSRDGEHAFALPLSGVRVERATLDGREAYPDASKPDRYGVTVSGRGKHKLAVRFAVVPTAGGSDREARFTGPDVPACRVTFTPGPTGKQADVPTRRGAQTVNGPAVVADHGSGRAVAVRWREEAGGKPPQPTVTVKEAGVWDVSETDAGLTAAFVFRIDGGATDRFKLEVPDGVHPTKVQARPTDPRAPGVGVRGWTVGAAANGWTPVEVRLQQPAEGRVLVVLRALPVAPLTGSPVLRFPRAVGPADADRDSLYAVRLSGVNVAGMALGGAIDFPADALVKDFPPVAEFGFDRAAPTRVVRRAVNAETEVRATLTPQLHLTAAGAEVGYTVGPWAEADGTFRATGKEVGHLEFDVPAGCDLRDVRAAGLAGWVRTGNRVQAWLKQPTTDLTVRWHAVLPGGDGTAELPFPRWPSRYTPADPLTARVRAADGWAVAPQQVPGLTPKPTTTPGELAYSVAPNTAAAKVTVRPTPPVAVKPPDPASTQTPAPAQPPPPKADPPAPAQPPPAETYSIRDGLRAGAWLAAFALVLVVGLSRSPAWRPECLACLGVLAAVAVGPDTTFGGLFWLTAAVGLGWRVARAVRGRAAG